MGRSLQIRNSILRNRATAEDGRIASSLNRRRKAGEVLCSPRRIHSPFGLERCACAEHDEVFPVAEPSEISPQST